MEPHKDKFLLSDPWKRSVENKSRCQIVIIRFKEKINQKLNKLHKKNKKLYYLVMKILHNKPGKWIKIKILHLYYKIIGAKLFCKKWKPSMDTWKEDPGKLIR